MGTPTDLPYGCPASRNIIVFASKYKIVIPVTSLGWIPTTKINSPINLAQLLHLPYCNHWRVNFSSLYASLVPPNAWRVFRTQIHASVGNSNKIFDTTALVLARAFLLKLLNRSCAIVYGAIPVAIQILILDKKIQSTETSLPVYPWVVTGRRHICYRSSLSN